MSEKLLSSIPITLSDLSQQMTEANNLIKSVSWSVKPDLNKDGPNAYVKSLESTEVAVSIKNLVTGITQEDELLSDVQLHVLRAIRTAIQVARHVAEDYSMRAGIPEKGGQVGWTQLQVTEANEKKQTAAAIALFVLARYIISDVTPMLSDNAFIESVNVNITEIDISRLVPALRCASFYLGKNIEKEVLNDDARLVAVVYHYAELLQKEMLDRIGSLKHTSFFIDLTYQLEDSDFGISGFALIDLSRSMSIEFNRLDFSQIVGNRDSKHFLYMDAKRRACYDPIEQKNPFLELGGITPMFMGSGVPGTGKSMAIAAYATYLHDICQGIGIPFLFHPLPDNIIDSFQGNSAKNMIAWMKPLQDPTRIVWAPIDDAENILENRTHQGVSEGVKAVIGVTLRYTEGAYAINRGNSAIGLFTNIPENIDPAVLSRIQARFSIDGARTVEDFLDQDQLWWSKLEKSEPGFVGMRDPANYQWQSAQGKLLNLGQVSGDLSKPKQDRVLEAYNAAMALADPDQHEFFANYFMNVQKTYKGFSSRDVRNIQAAVNLRIMDFDLPDIWFETRAPFADKPYDEKLAMILELRRANMGGLNFSEIRMQETNRYLDEMVRIADAEFGREVEKAVQDHRKTEAVRHAIAQAA